MIEEIKKHNMGKSVDICFRSKKIRTEVKCYTDICANYLVEFAEVFNRILGKREKSENYINVTIIEDSFLLEMALNIIKDEKLILTSNLIAFNEATANSSLAKCSVDKNYYIMKCYDYFFYIYDRAEHQCYMIIGKNKKANTMVNILLLTPYLMYGELFAVHGGLVTNGKKNLLISNLSMGGKTTFAILFAAHGWKIVTEETTYITNEGKILPYNIRNYFNIRVGTYLSFKNYFIDNGIINKEFLQMDNFDSNQLYDFGKKYQLAIDFDKLAKTIILEEEYITDFIKVSIQKDETCKMEILSPHESIDAFLKLSLAPTVCLFEELLNYMITDIDQRRKQLEGIFDGVNSISILSGLDYKEKFEWIIKNL